MGKNKNYSSKVKAKVIKELIEQKKTHSDIAFKYNISARTVQLWYKKILNSLEKVFSEKAKERIVRRKHEKEINDSKELKTQFNWLRNAVMKLNVNTKKALIDRHNKQLSIVTQCKVLGLNRSSLYYRPKSNNKNS